MKKILIAVDGSEDSDKALFHGGNLASCGCKGINIEVVVITVQRPLESYLSLFDLFLKKTAPEDEKEIREKYESIGRGLLNESKKSLEKEGVTKVKTVVKEGKPAEEILKVAEEEKVDLVIIGSRGKGLAKTVFGSVSREVAMGSKVPVMIVR